MSTVTSNKFFVAMSNVILCAQGFLYKTISFAWCAPANDIVPKEGERRKETKRINMVIATSIRFVPINWTYIYMCISIYFYVPQLSIYYMKYVCIYTYETSSTPPTTVSNEHEYKVIFLRQNRNPFPHKTFIIMKNSVVPNAVEIHRSK